MIERFVRESGSGPQAQAQSGLGAASSGTLGRESGSGPQALACETGRGHRAHRDDSVRALHDDSVQGCRVGKSESKVLPTKTAKKEVEAKRRWKEVAAACQPKAVLPVV